MPALSYRRSMRKTVGLIDAFQCCGDNNLQVFNIFTHLTPTPLQKRNKGYMQQQQLLLPDNSVVIY